MKNNFIKEPISSDISNEWVDQIREWNKTEVIFPKDLCVHHLFMEQAKKTPTSLAVSIGNSNLTYQELDEKSNQLAHYLKKQGVKSDTFVGLFLDRSLELIIGIFAILKAGGTYVPIDTEYPLERISYILDDSKVSVLLTLSSTRVIPDNFKGETIFLDTDWKTVATHPKEIPEISVSLSDFIYVIYTSGSTGKPKGTLVYHSGFLNLLQWYTSEFTFAPGANVLLLSSTSFDLTQKNIFAPLLCGGSLVLLDSPVFDANIIEKTIKKHNITSINCTPSTFQGLVSDSPLERLKNISSLRQVFLGGEPIVIPKIEDWLNNKHCDATVINSYGPTECTDVCAYYKIKDYKQFLNIPVPIGRPIYNTQLYIVDDDLNLVSEGQEGELCIAGAGIGGGYWGKKELTDEKFIPNPFDESNNVIYKTGDRTKFLPDGNIEYLGRIDQQVKIRGFRIELGEIESILDQHPDLKESVVIGRAKRNGEKQLVAYMVSLEEQRPETDNIRSFLQKSLPDYMLPTAWVFINELPLTPNGKIDRNALPSPGNERPNLTQQYVTSSTDLESRLSKMWSDILDVDKVGIKDPFFELGGTSLQSIQFISRLNRELGESIPIASFFAAPTINGCIQILERDYSSALKKWVPDHNMTSVRSEMKTTSLKTDQKIKFDDIAIIGMAGRFPGAEDIDEFWDNVKSGTEFVNFASDDDLRFAGVGEDDIQDEEYNRSYFSAENLDGFDADFFGYQPREAETMDPQHRLFLELAWTALDNAGYSKDSERSARTGIFGGVARDAYLQHFVSRHPRYKDSLGDFIVNIGNDKNFPCTRVAYKLDLNGPAINVQTACSTSGVALHLACQSLHLGEVTMAIVGGCRVLVPTKFGYRNVEGSALSDDGHIYTFDERGSGMVRGSGGAFLVLKRLSDAKRDKDCIRAIIKSTAINNDGNLKAGFTAPSVEGQVEVVESALLKAKVSPETIGHIEAHGTATAIGDPIEIMALNRAYRMHTDKQHYCYLGAVKTSIGHLDAGAANAGIIKSVFMLENGIIPPSLNYKKPNSKINFEDSPFTVNLEKLDWPIHENVPRRAGVSSFGLGGTNFHAIFEQSPAQSKTKEVIKKRPVQLLTFSAKSEIALNANVGALPRYLDQHSDITLTNLAYTINTFRPQLEHRSLILLETQKGISRESLTNSSKQNVSGAIPPPMAFVFPPYGKDVLPSLVYLTKHEPQSHQIIDRCCKVISPNIIFDTNEERIHFLSQCKEQEILLFISEYLFANLWISWGIKPAFFCGVGIGLFVAACISGAISLPDVIKLLKAKIYQNQTDTEKPLGEINLQPPGTPIIANNSSKPFDCDSLAKSLSTMKLKTAEDNQNNILGILHTHEISILLEIGTAPVFLHKCISNLAADNLGFQILPSLDFVSEVSNYKYDITETLGQLWLSGQPVNWKVYYREESVQKVPLPPYKFLRQRHWLDLPGIGPQIVIIEADSEDEFKGVIANTIDLLQSERADNDMFGAAIKPTKRYRKGFVFKSRTDAIQRLTRDGEQQIHTSNQATNPAEIAFMLPGVGTHYFRMGIGLYERYGEFRKSIDEGIALFAARTGCDLSKLIYAPLHLKDYATSELDRPSIGLPAIFITEIALTRLWQSWGVQPSALIGHSLGENTAACISGVISYPDALGLVTLRGALFEKTEGCMLSVPLSIEEITPILNNNLDIATINSPSQCVVSGKQTDIESFNQFLEKQNIEAQRLPFNTACHSKLLDPVLNEFRDYLRGIELHPPQIPFVSNVTGDWIEDEQAMSPDYWATHLRSTVRFADSLQTVTKNDKFMLVEVGPGKTLSSLAKSQKPKLAERIISSLRHSRENAHDRMFLMNSVTKMLVSGVSFNWNALNKEFPDLIKNVSKDALSNDIYNFSSKKLNANATSSIAAQPVDSAPTVANPNIIERNIIIMSRKNLISKKLSELISEMSGIDEEDLENEMTFIDLGFDSLILTQVNIHIKKTFNIKTTLKHLLDETPSIDTLSDFIDSELPADALQTELEEQNATLLNASTTTQSSEAGFPNVPAQKYNNEAVMSTNNQSHSGSILSEMQNCSQQNNATGSNPTVAGNVHTLIAQQLQIMQLQLQAVGQGNIQIASQKTINVDEKPQKHQEQVNTKRTDTTIRTKNKTSHTPGTRIVREKLGIKLTKAQNRWLANIMIDYQEKFATSKKKTQEHRKYLADPRTVSGFNPEWKEIVFPIVTIRSKGSKLWDIDDNEFIDLSNGFGPIIFGHSPDFVTEAVKKQIDLGIETGPQSPLAGEVAKLFCELTGNERCTFACTGSEAVTGAIRLARTVTARSKIVMFGDSYHGISDEVINRAGKNYQAFPAAPGIQPEATSNMINLPWCSPESLEIIEKLGPELAAVLVEPVQSRRPDIHDQAFLKAIREITLKSETAMILDEVVTGFRVHPGGIRKLFDIDADLATYGKVLGGGYPIGIIGGKAKFMDALDGGHWQYGDDSIPESGVTFFAGTFVRHPPALAAAMAVLQKIQNEGNGLYKKLAKGTSNLASEAKLFIKELKSNVSFEEFSSFFYVSTPSEAHWGHMLFALMRLEGIHIQQFRPNFMTTAHSQEDIEKILGAFKKSLALLVAHGLLDGDMVVANKFLGSKSEIPEGAKLGKNSRGEPAYFIEDAAQKGKYIEVAKP